MSEQLDNSDNDNITIRVKTPRFVGNKSIDQQSINAYLMNQMELMEERFVKQLYPGPFITANVIDSDDDDDNNNDVIDLDPEN